MENLNQEKIEEVVEEVVNDEVPQEPKVITLTVGINGVPELNIQCEKDITIRDMATALATIDVLNFNNYRQTHGDDAVRNYVLFNTLRKEMFLNGVANLLGDKEEIEKVLPTLVELI